MFQRNHKERKLARKKAAFFNTKIKVYIFLLEMNSCQQPGVLNRPQSATANKNMDLFLKRSNSPLGETTKKISFDQDNRKRDSDTSINSRPTVGTEDREECQGQNESKKTGSKAMTSILGAFLRKEKQLPNKSQTVSPQPIQANHSPLNVKTSHVPGYFPGARSTLKPQVKKSGLDRSFFHQRSPQDDFARVKTPNRSFNFIKKQIKSTNDIPYTGRSKHLLQQQNQILKEQNQLLRGELMQIKKQLMFGSPSKKEEIISNLRDTIKKEDAVLKEYKLKMDIANKRVISLNSMLETKDQEIQMLTHKIQSMQVQMEELKHKNNERYQGIKEKMIYVIQAYGEVEKKFCNSEIQWMKFKEAWAQEKSIYVHRIQFLQEVLSND